MPRFEPWFLCKALQKKYSTIPSTTQIQILACSVDQQAQAQPRLFSVISSIMR